MIKRVGEKRIEKSNYTRSLLLPSVTAQAPHTAYCKRHDVTRYACRGRALHSSQEPLTVNSLKGQMLECSKELGRKL